ncbi:MAG: DUF4340 domain-containing protein [Cyclobacteriaceae bacterium]|nr:DUF4340 domain-containing protein [Cyclobacteriaceae bacterium]
MIKNVRTIRLLVFLIILVLVYISLKLFKDTGRSRSFRQNLVQIDTADVSKIIISKPGESFQVIKENGSWKVSISRNKTVNATNSSVKNALGTLMSIKPDRIATRDPENWKDYQVDSTGTRVQVFEGNKNTLDLVIGRFGVQGQQQFHTFVRLQNDNEVYAANDFMGISFPSEPNSFRNSRFLQMETDSIFQITFHYPADSSFILNRSDSVWFVGSQQADSASVAEYLSDLRFISATGFVDDVEPATLLNPVFKVEIQSGSMDNQVVEAYRHQGYNYIYHSSYNPEVYFSDEKLNSQIFINQENLLNSSGEE